MSTAILVLLIFQAGAAHPAPPSQVQVSQMSAFATIGPDFGGVSPPDAAFEERELMQRLNALAKALNAFGATYKNGQVDLNNVKAVRKAMHELEKSEWFRPPKS